jgi:hypothetical protein
MVCARFMREIAGAQLLSCKSPEWALTSPAARGASENKGANLKFGDFS